MMVLFSCLNSDMKSQCRLFRMKEGADWGALSWLRATACNLVDIDIGMRVWNRLNMACFIGYAYFFTWWAHANVVKTGRFFYIIRFMIVIYCWIYVSKNVFNGIFYNET